MFIYQIYFGQFLYHDSWEDTEKTYEVIMSVQVTVFFHVNIVFVRLDVMVVMLKEQSSPLGTERYSHANSFLRSS